MGHRCHSSNCSVPLEGETVNKNAPPSVELPPRAFQYMSASGREAGILPGKAGQGGVDGLLLGTDQTDGDLALLQREDLRAEHRRVGNAHQLELLRLGEAAGDDEEPRPVGRGVDVRRLDLPIDPLLLGRQAVEVGLRGRRQGLDDVLHRIR